MTDLPQTPAHVVRDTVTDGPRQFLRVEGAALLAVATIAFQATGGSWWLFAALFLVPDVSMLGYLANKRLGALVYNLGHTTVLPLGLSALGYWMASPFAVSIGLIWLAHIGFDRVIGYGLKYGDDFQHTHLGTPFR